MISSMAAYYGIDRVVAYAASKSAVEGMVKVLASEFSGNGVRVNAIAPGFIETAMSRTAMNSDPDRRDRAMRRTPMGKFGQPDDIGHAAVFLASEPPATSPALRCPWMAAIPSGFNRKLFLTEMDSVDACNQQHPQNPFILPASRFWTCPES